MMETVFGAVRKSFEAYTDLLHQGTEKWEPEYGVEVSQRLEHMDFIVWRVKELFRPSWMSEAWAQQELQRSWRGKGKLNFEGRLFEHLQAIAPSVVNGIELRVMAEAFYFIADRARVTIRQLPDLKKFDSPGVREVRNHLIAHPEGAHSGVIENGWGYDPSVGVTIKAVRRSDNTDLFVDKGLYPNAEEFSALLEEKLAAAISRLRGEVA